MNKNIHNHRTIFFIALESFFINSSHLFVIEMIKPKSFAFAFRKNKKIKEFAG